MNWDAWGLSAETYLLWTRIQCTAWTTADIAIVIFLLRIANLARRVVARRRHVFSYGVLAATALFLPLVWIAPTGALLFWLEILITVPHFLLIVYIILANLRIFPEAFRLIFLSRRQV